MGKMKILKVINPLMLLLVLYQGITGFLRHGMYEHFRAVHPVAGGLLILLGLVHLILNWPWVRSSYFRRKP